MTIEADDLQKDLRALIEARRDIDRALAEKHSRTMAVLFTDIVGSTQFFEERGDVEGLARVHEHNALLFPCVENNGGRVVKTIGDAIMAVFEEAEQAANCAAEMQQALRVSQPRDNDAIRVRIGAHIGSVLVDGDDVFGDTVNTAARVAGAADGDEVLLSLALYDTLPNHSEHRARPRGELAFKGKAEPLAVVELLWSDDDLEMSGELALRAELFVLELRQADGGLRVSVTDGTSDEGAVRGYAQLDVTSAKLDDYTRHLGTLAHGGGERTYLDDLATRGAELFATALSDRAQRELQATGHSFLRMHLDEGLAHVPWELMHDGEDFLGLRFAVGRVVTTQHDGATAAPAADGSGRFVVVSNPSGGLSAASREGDAVRRLLEDSGAGEVKHLDGALTRADFLAAIAGCRLLHFAGHTHGDALQLADGDISSEELANALKGGAPELVFANACRAATAGGFEDAARGAGSMAARLLLDGVGHYLAPAWEVPDDDALVFALRFYESVVRGVPYGEAARRARVALKDARDARPLSFGGYTLYGDPRTSLSGVRAKPQRPKVRAAVGPSGATPAAPSARPPRAKTPPPSARASDAALLGVEHRPEASPEPPYPGHPGKIIIISLTTAVVSALAAIPFLLPDPPEPPPLARSAAPPAEPKAKPLPQQQNEEPAPKGAGALRHDGPVRISVLPFKQLGNDEALAYLKGGLAEVVVTDLGETKGVQLIERTQIDIDIGEIEFGQSKYVDPATRAALGKIAGAEVVVVGSYQQAGAKMRFAARFVNVETGEIIGTARSDGAADDPFALQDTLVAEVRKLMTQVREKMRP